MTNILNEIIHSEGAAHQVGPEQSFPAYQSLVNSCKVYRGAGGGGGKVPKSDN